MRAPEAAPGGGDDVVPSITGAVTVFLRTLFAVLNKDWELKGPAYLRFQGLSGAAGAAALAAVAAASGAAPSSRTSSRGAGGGSSSGVTSRGGTGMTSRGGGGAGEGPLRPGAQLQWLQRIATSSRDLALRGAQ
jgi:hypothetical protein